MKDEGGRMNEEWRMNKMEGIEERSARRRRIIVGHVAKDFADAERWDLGFRKRHGLALPKRSLSVKTLRCRKTESHARPLSKYEQWELEFWLSKTPEERLAASLVISKVVEILWRKQLNRKKAQESKRKRSK
jgi:hypothetical protein